MVHSPGYPYGTTTGIHQEMFGKPTVVLQFLS